jgi:hypothetical protein
MTAFTSAAPLPMRFPATNPPVAGDHIDIGVWPNGWRFMTTRDRIRFDQLPADVQAEYRSAFDAQGRELARR